MPPPAAHLAPRADQLDAALLERTARIGNSRSGIERVNLAQAVALGAHALRAVEAEQLRAGRLEAQIAMRAGVMGRKERCRRADGGGRRVRFGTRRFLFAWLGGLPPLPPCLSAFRGGSSSSIATIRLPSPSLQRQLDGFGQPRRRTLGPATSRSMTTSMLCRIWRSSRRSSLQVDDPAVDPRADEALLEQVVEQVAVFALLAADQRRQQQKPRAGRQAP